MPRTSLPSKQPLADLKDSELRELDRVERDAILRFEGQFDDLEKALGMLRLLPHLGWKPVVLMHSKRTIAKYEQILDIKFSEQFPPEGPSWKRSPAYGVARKLTNYWKAVSGEVSVGDRQSFVTTPTKGT